MQKFKNTCSSIPSVLLKSDLTKLKHVLVLFIFSQGGGVGIEDKAKKKKLTRGNKCLQKYIQSVNEKMGSWNKPDLIINKHHLERIFAVINQDMGTRINVFFPPFSKNVKTTRTAVVEGKFSFPFCVRNVQELG